MSASSWWDENKGTIYKATKATANATYKGAKTVSKAGYKTYQNHQANSKGQSISHDESNNGSPVFQESNVRPLSALQDVKSFPAPPLRAEQMRHTDAHTDHQQAVQPQEPSMQQNYHQPPPQMQQAIPAPPNLPSRGPVPPPPTQQPVASTAPAQIYQQTQAQAQTQAQSQPLETTSGFGSFQSQMEAEIQSQINKQVQKQVDIQGIESSQGGKTQQVQAVSTESVVGGSRLPPSHPNVSATSSYIRAPAPIPPQVASQNIQEIDNQLDVLRSTTISPDLNNINKDMGMVIPPRAHSQTEIAQVGSTESTTEDNEEEEKPPTPLIASGHYNSNIQVAFAPPPKHQDRSLHIPHQPKFRTEKAPTVKRLNSSPSPAPITGGPPPPPLRTGSSSANIMTAGPDPSSEAAEGKSDDKDTEPKYSITGVISPQTTESLSKFAPPPRPSVGNMSKHSTGSVHGAISRPPPPPVIPSRSGSTTPSISAELPPYSEVEQHQNEAVTKPAIVGALKKDDNLDQFAPPPKPFRRPSEQQQPANGIAHAQNNMTSVTGGASRPVPPPPPTRPVVTDSEGSTSNIETPVPAMAPPKFDISQFLPPPKPSKGNIVDNGVEKNATEEDEREEEIHEEVHEQLVEDDTLEQNPESVIEEEEPEETEASSDAVNEIEKVADAVEELQFHRPALKPIMSRPLTLSPTPLRSSSQINTSSKFNPIIPLPSASTFGKPAIKPKPIIPAKHFNVRASGGSLSGDKTDDAAELIPSQTMLRHSVNRAKPIAQAQGAEEAHKDEIDPQKAIPIIAPINKKVPPPIKPKPLVSSNSLDTSKSSNSVKTQPIIKPKPAVHIASKPLNLNSVKLDEGKDSSISIDYSNTSAASGNGFFALRKTGISLQDKPKSGKDIEQEENNDDGDDWDSDKEESPVVKKPVKPIIPSKPTVLSKPSIQSKINIAGAPIKPIKPVNIVPPLSRSATKNTTATPSVTNPIKSSTSPPPPPASRGSAAGSVQPEKKLDEIEVEQEDEEENPFKRYLKAAVPKEDNHIKSRFS